MTRGCEYAGDAGDEAGKRVRGPGAAGRVEFSDRQRSHPRISSRRHERLGGLVEARARDEVEDVDVDVEGERPGRKLVKDRPDGVTRWC